MLQKHVSIDDVNGHKYKVLGVNNVVSISQTFGVVYSRRIYRDDVDMVNEAVKKVIVDKIPGNAQI